MASKNKVADQRVSTSQSRAKTAGSDALEKEKADPSIVAFANLSAAYEKQGLWEHAESTCGQAMEILPRDEKVLAPELYMRRAKWRKNTGKKEEAIEDAQTFIKKFPFNPGVDEMNELIDSFNVVILQNEEQSPTITIEETPTPRPSRPPPSEEQKLPKPGRPPPQEEQKLTDRTDISQDVTFRKAKTDSKLSLEKINQLIKSAPVKNGSEWVLIPQQFFHEWKRRFKCDETHIDLTNENMTARVEKMESLLIDQNMPILYDPDPVYQYTNVPLRDDLIKDIDYSMLPETVYKQYFSTEILQPIRRYVAQNNLETHLKQIPIITTLDFKPLYIQVSASTTASQLHSKVIRCLQSPSVKLWVTSEKTTPDQLKLMKENKGKIFLENSEELQRDAMALCKILIKADNKLVVEVEPFQFTTEKQPGKWGYCMKLIINGDRCPVCEQVEY